MAKGGVVFLLFLCVFNVAVYLDGASSSTGPAPESSSTGSQSSSTGSAPSSTGSVSSSTGSAPSSTGSASSSTGPAPTTAPPTHPPTPLPPAAAVVVKGKYMFVEATGEQFFFKGINYLPVPGKSSRDADWYTDSNANIWTRDIPILKNLGVNAIRIRFVDPKNSHKKFMTAMENAGIYVVIDMDPDQQFHQTPPVYDMVLWTKVQGIIDEFSRYQNTLLFVACNEMISGATGVSIAPYAKALIRDMKRYMNDIMEDGRVIPVTFASLSTKSAEPTYRHVIDYYTCGPDWAAADVAGMNMLWWIPTSTPETSGYSDLWATMKTYPKPLIFTEFSSVNPVDASTGECPCQNRTFKQVPEMLTHGAESLTGGMVFEYSDEQELAPSPQAISNNKGVVRLDGNKVVPKTEFNTLKARYALDYPTRLNMSEYTPTGDPIICPSAGIWANVAPLPPAPFDASSSTGQASTGHGPGSGGGLSKTELIAIAAGGGAIGLCILVFLGRKCMMMKQQGDYEPMDD